MRGSIVPLIAALGLTATAALVAQQPAGQQQPAAVGDALQGVPGVPVFRSTLNLVLVDVVVRDKSGAVVRGLTPDDFELLEDGVRQKIVTLAYEEIKPGVEPIQNASVLANVRPDNRPAVAVGGNTAKPAAAEPHPLTSDETAGHRLVTLVFDTSSMEPDNVQKAVDAAADWVDTRMTSADLVAVATIGSGLQVLADFSSDPEQVHAALSTLSAAHGTAFDAVDASTTATDEQLQSATDDSTTVDQSAQELDTFNNDVRLRALKTLAEALQPIQQKKALIYFSAGMERSGTDNQVELRAAVNAAVRANVSIYPVDARGLQAVVPGGSARQASRGGLAAFSGSAVSRQFSQLAAQQETLTSLASDTGGTAFTDTNDFGEAFARVERDISSYYLLGFSSTNTNRDGRYRRITVRVRNRSGLKIQAKEGYYADRDFAHTARNDREVQLQEQLGAAIAATDVPLFVTTGWFRLAPDKYYVPISVAVPGSAISPRQEGAPSAATGLDIAGFIRLPHQRHLAAGPLLREGGRSRERRRPDGNVRNADRCSRIETVACQSELDCSRHAVAVSRSPESVQPGCPRRRRSRAEPHAHRRAQSRALFLLRGIRSDPGERNGAAADEPVVLSRQSKGLRHASRRALSHRCRRSEGRDFPIRDSGGQRETGAVHLSGEHHRRGWRTFRVSASATVRSLNHAAVCSSEPAIKPPILVAAVSDVRLLNTLLRADVIAVSLFPSPS
jgi:VWFA-related protein